jgi:hypothetical protein
LKVNRFTKKKEIMPHGKGIQKYIRGGFYGRLSHHDLVRKKEVQVRDEDGKN